MSRVSPFVWFVLSLMFAGACNSPDPLIADEAAYIKSIKNGSSRGWKD